MCAFVIGGIYNRIMIRILGDLASGAWPLLLLFVAAFT